MGIKHAILSASSSHRWLNCPPSALLCAKQKDENSSYAKEGSEAHELGEYKIASFLGEKRPNNRKQLEYLNQDMEHHTDDYASYVIERFTKSKNEDSSTILLLEQTLDFSHWVPKGFGTGDALIISNKKIIIVDFKYGAGVLVAAEGNTQLMCYALGAIAGYGHLYDFDEIEMVIFQPRKSNVDSYVMSKSDVLHWAKTVLKPIAQLAIQGKGEFKAGEHCRFCQVKELCETRAEYHMELAKYEFLEANKLSKADIERILSKVDSLINWANDVKAYALKLAMAGTKWSKFKLVEGRSNRKFNDADQVVNIVKNSGYDPYEHKLKGIVAMEKMLGNKVFNELLGSYVEKSPGKPTLVPISDKRSEILIID